MNDGRKSYAKELVRQRTGREVPDVLRDLYVEKRHTQQEIAKALGVGRMAVSAWLAEYGISRDDRAAIEMPAEASA